MNDELVILDGFHAVKHGLRFGAKIIDIITVKPEVWQRLAAELAPDVAAELATRVREVPVGEFERVSSHPTGIAGVARRPGPGADITRRAHRSAPVVLLEDPRRPGNVGAAIRVAAASGAGGLITTGALDPWQAAAVRGSAGLHYALPVVRVEDTAALEGPLVVFDPAGEAVSAARALPNDAIFIFGTEREGVTEDLRRRADLVLSLPMREGVSSLNLATSVAAVMYYWRLGRTDSEDSA